MFVRYYLELPMPFEEAERALLTEPHAWVPGLARDAEHRSEGLLAEVGFHLAEDRRIGKRVEIELGTPHRMPSKTVLPMVWRATSAESLFPSLDADLEVASLGPHRSQLSISARYRPPMGALGRVLDRALLHRVAEATIKDFLDRVGQALQSRVSAG